MEIIEKAIEMFAMKGYHETSVQEIASALSISKGGFYTYFPSKDDLIIEIFHYYSEKMRSEMQKVSEELPPKARMKEQLKVQIENFISHQPFMKMHFREQNASIIKGLQIFMRKNYFEMCKWYEQYLIKVYGPEIEPYVADAVTICEGIKQSFLRTFVWKTEPVETAVFADYLMERYDDVIKGLMKSDYQPILDKKKMEKLLKPWTEKEEKVEEAKELLEKMKQLLSLEPHLDISEEEITQIIEFLMNEVKKEYPQKLMIQGMLANLKGIQRIKNERERFAEIMNVQLL
ncbi:MULTISPECIES: TetR/AcrR family transcriptional regulator [unclassified Bacillus (in: firmicutes)]|uniref:TetR/AcrR family transcriptional regulator n=1 Tax=unclassified Bacillus (in: firmicutes) TaxID=185979 RepID=UPI0008E8DEE2|nr:MULTISPECIES: TetR/AcrR family transcriptional regulator [unclassified Bacillus (in: firmicutes)]SFA85540.1 DNA-binding transcriptional regulator, AcrR family [Bacillus sp. UNCCL13]SFQ83453.1 DNA-binding transcriptional regulator, AcrR family [Bacillus sp. cl95]